MSLIFGTVFANRRFRTAQIINFSSVAVIVLTNMVNSFLGNHTDLRHPYIYLMLLGCIGLMVSFRVMTVQGGLIKNPVIGREIRKRPDDTDYLLKVRERWSMMHADVYFQLTDTYGIANSDAVRWAGSLGEDGIQYKDMLHMVPDFVGRSINPELFINLWNSGITDLQMVANFAENDIDSVAANALIAGSETD
jgi:hypothetical protein